MQMSSNEGWHGGKYPCLVAFATTEFSIVIGYKNTISGGSSIM